MTLKELADLLVKQEQMGLRNVPLCLKMTRKSKRLIKTKRIKTPFGLTRWHRHSETELVIYPSFEQVLRYVLRRLGL